MLADGGGRRGTVRPMAQRSLLLPAMAIAAVLGAVVMAVVVAGGGGTGTSAAASSPATVTVPAGSTGAAPAATGDASAGDGQAGQDDQGGSGGQDDQGGFGDEGDQGEGDQGDGSFVTVPSLAGMRLDDATSALQQAGLDRQVDGGGLFGVLDDTAWTVCATTPDAGTEVVPGEVVVVHVDRACI
jgi:hypothetical protein